MHVALAQACKMCFTMLLAMGISVGKEDFCIKGCPYGPFHQH